jgi:quinol monooxygenase YgiN
MPEIVVVATLKAREGQEDAARDALIGLVEATHRDAGCILYSLHQGIDDPSRLTFVERWATRGDLDAHMGTDHIAAVLARADELLADPPDIVVFEPVAAGEQRKGTLAGATG